MRNFRFFLAASAASIATCVAISPAHAQETTSSVRGTVTAEGAPVAGAAVTVTHVPSGTVSRTTTGADGSFSTSGLRIGGPYTIMVSAPGYLDATVTDANLTAGQTFRLPIALTAEGETIVVTASAVTGAGSYSQGPASAFTRDDIEGVASVNRDIRDVVRRDAFATLDLTNSRAVSIAGQNPRFNRFSVDGVQFSDDFGLNNGGLPTGRGPVPLDAIGQVSVKVAPYDISAGDLQGGAIDVVLLSGTNDWHGTGFYSFSSDGLTGNRTKDRPLNLDFESRVYGATLRGPIIPDRLFFMVSGERARESTPINIGPIGGGFGSEVQGVTQGLLDRISGIAQSVYDYDAGGVPTSNTERDDKVVVKLDANLSDNHRAALTYIHNDGSFYVQTGRDNNFYSGTEFSATRPQYGLSSNNYILSEKVHSGVFQLNSDWSDTFSTEARVAYRKYTRGQNPTQGANFSQFSICADETSQVDPAVSASPTTCTSGVPVINIGPDASRHFNALESENFSGQFLGELNLNSHRVRLLAGFENVKTYNAFLQHALGTYYFDSIQDFQNRRASALRYQGARSQELSDAAAQFRYTMFTFGIMDDWEVTPDFTFTYGVRWDVYDMNTPVPLNSNVYNRLGFTNTATLGGRDVLQPRVGFDWRVNDRLSVRGGGGLFGGGSPDVWVSNSYSNTGIVTSSLTIQRNAAGAVTGGPAAGLLNVTGQGVAQAVMDAVSNASAGTTGSTALLDPELKLPSQWKFSLSADYRADFGALGDGWNFGADLLYTRVKDALVVTNARFVKTGATTLDGRPKYVSVVGPTDSNEDLMLTNGDQGRSIVGVVRFDKSFQNGFSFGGSYTWQDVKELSPLTSSTPGSNFTNAVYVDPNYPAYGTANDQIKWQFKYYAGFEHAFFGDYKTRFQLFGETRDGRAFSYTMNDASAVGGVSQLYGINRTGGRHLLYVPNVSSQTADANVVYASTAVYEAVRDLVNGSVLKNFQGQTAPKNVGRSPSFTKIDLHMEQEIPAVVGRSRITLFADIENVLNLLNRDWGQLRQVAFPYQAAVVTVTCGNAACTQYRYASPTTPQEVVQTRQSVYQVRLGARFSF
ncbi:carboxypeptidase regulatory-like domain-containing protein [Sphingobium sp. B11D3D]|uniref:TonB-dependent receptor n=1 Tax=Sphingobium sp. B11D3D TaxID=2940576 RepID=UPI002224AE6F|nr:carboxypeptidase regulatory-like domain-containing protein [Sphingobium sp. B11D3D]MCW2371022.1 hypothetical protein [Sphingobium sp. B11D3D]